MKNNSKKASLIHKKLSFALFLFSFTYTLSWSDVPVALLYSVPGNSQMILKYKNAIVDCRPFGIKTIEAIQQESNNKQECPDAIAKMYTNHPSTKYFARQTLHLEQTYHFSMLNQKCILYANGPETYSEMLLSKGLAVVDESFDHKEWNEKLKRAYARGVKEKNGMHSEDSEILRLCIEKKE